ncbi:Small-conductance mechanosensitive channel [Sphingomonas antarctica]|uniref:mechanosensitive ion channel family protein n=1 Tax=Sphingomonas antarctica TaxID=2040274 RepID=UPI0039E8AA60
MPNSTAVTKTTTVRLPIESRPDELLRSSYDWAVAHTTQIIFASIVAGVVVALLLGAKWAGGWLMTRYASSNHWRRIIGGALAKIRLWFIVAVAAQLVSLFAHAPDDVAKVVYFVFVIATTLQAAVFAREIILGLIEYRAAATDHSGLQSAIGIIRLLVTIVLFAVAIVLILGNLGVNVTGLIAGLGVGGIAIGLAAQGIFADLFAALAILFDRPFRKGDSIKVDTLSGTVEDIGLKSTRIRAITGEQVIVANKQLLEKEIHNLARLSKRRTVVMLGVTYETPVDLLERLPQIMREIVEGCDDTKLVRCGLMKFGDSSLDFELQYDVHSEDYDIVFARRHVVHIAILKRFAELGIAFAYPVQVGYTAAPDGRFVNPCP